MQEQVFTPLLENTEHPAWKTESARKPCAKRDQWIAGREEGPDEQGQSHDYADDDELALGPVEPGLRDTYRDRYVLLLLVADLQLLERALDLLAANFRRAAAAGRARDRLGACDALLALLGVALTGQDRVDKHPDKPAYRERNHEK